MIASNYFLINYQKLQPQRETVLISDVLDGDTIRLEDGRTIRLLNINSPEKNQPLSELATNYLKQYENQTIQLEIQGTGVYGRLLGRIFSKDYLNLELIKKGFAHKYIVDDSELKLFIKEEEKARNEELGIWERSPHYMCLDVEINKKEEYVIIVNICDQDLNLALKDETTRTFNFEIKALSSITVYSGEGQDIEKEIYLNSKRNIWNDDKDSIFIRDSNGLLIFYDSYGY